MTGPLQLPPLGAPADDTDQLDWNVDRDGRMFDFAVTPDQELVTLPVEDAPARRMGAARFDLPTALRARGLTVEVVPGWETRSAGSFNPGGALCHWTAGPKGSTSRPSLNICVNGRPDLPGPLCNVYLDRRGVAVVVAAGRANHAGAGNWRGLVGNSALWGTEAEAAGADDWTDEQRWAYPRINAAYADLSGFDASMVAGHSEFAGPRKQDINGYPMAEMRTQTAAVLAGTEEHDMQLSDQIESRANEDIDPRTGKGKLVSFGNLVQDIQARVDGIGDVLGPLDRDLRGDLAAKGRQITALTSTVSALTELVAAQNGLTVADVENAVMRAVAAGVRVVVTTG